jgi:hypothetical protein
VLKYSVFDSVSGWVRWGGGCTIGSERERFSVSLSEGTKSSVIYSNCPKSASSWRVYKLVEVQFYLHLYWGRGVVTKVQFLMRLSLSLLKNMILNYLALLQCIHKPFYPTTQLKWGTALQAGRSRDRYPMVSLEFFIDIVLPAALWRWC